LLLDPITSFARYTPINISDDFLVYELAPSGNENDTVQSICITVGKISLLPIQMKVYFIDGDYDLLVFDYEAPEKLPEYFVQPAIQGPNGRGEVVLDGKETILDIQGAPGLKQAVVRLHGKYEGPANELPADYRRILPMKFRKTYESKGGPIFKLDAAFITEDDYRSSTNDVISDFLPS
jgi:hypothetical protein